jgi:hypothetical protein
MVTDYIINFEGDGDDNRNNIFQISIKIYSWYTINTNNIFIFYYHFHSSFVL